LLKLSRLADYAVVILSCLTLQERQAATARALAQQSGIPWPTTVKLLKILAGAGLLASRQGRRGGYRLVRDPAQITLGEVVEAVEGPLALTECSRRDGTCHLQPVCRIQDRWVPISGAVRATLDAISLQEVAARPGSATDSRRNIEP
jgi:FeS assembly SUF system regulator